MNFDRYTRRRLARRLDRQNSGVARIVDAMRRGQTLHMHHTRLGECWWLSSGKAVAAQTAQQVILSPLVTSATDALFTDVRPQSYRYRFSKPTT